MRKNAVVALICDIGMCMWLALICRMGDAAEPTAVIDSGQGIRPAQGRSGDSSACARSDTAFNIQGEESAAGRGGAEELGAVDAAAECVNVNTADSAALVKLKGIGPVLAGRIIAYRAQHGKFTKAKDLIVVKGIGPAKLEKIRQDICF